MTEIQKQDDIVHAQERDTPTTRTVVFALDHSEHSAKAFNWAFENIFRKDDLVILANVRPVATVPGPYGTMYMDFTDFVTQVEEQYRVESHQLLKKFAERLKDGGYHCKAIAMRGDARSELIRKTQEVKADLFVIGSRGLGAIKRTFLGSVSDYCVHHLHCPVIVYREKE